MHNKNKWAAAALALVLSAALADGLPPVAPVRDQVDTWHGVQVHDPYRYMENLQDPAVRGWILAQGAYTRGVLDRLAVRAQIEQRLKVLDAGLGDRRHALRRLASGALFYRLNQRDGHQVKIAMRAGPDAPERVLVDPERMARETGVPHAVNWFEPSWDGRYLAYGVSAGGSENATLHVLDVGTGQDVGEPVPRVPAEGVSWLPDSRTVAYNQLRQLTAEDAATEQYLDSAVHLLKVGQPADQARAVFGPTVNRELGLRRLDNARLLFTPGSPWVVAATNDTTQREGFVFVARVDDLLAGPAAWKRLASFDDHWTALELRGNQLFYLTSKDAPRHQVMRLDLRDGTTKLAARQPAEGPIEGFALGRTQLVTQVRTGANIVLRVHAGNDVAGKPLPTPLQGAASIADEPSHARDDFVVQVNSWAAPARAFLVGSQPARALHAFDIQTPPGAPQLAVRDVMVPSHDGVLVPMTVLHRRDLVRSQPHPTLLLGYGSYGLSQTAGFHSHWIPWLERGGVIAVANVRGSGALGEDWRLAGTRLKKPNTWKDAIACGQYLVDQGYATPRLLSVMAGSAGGIFAGRAITEAPQLFGAAVIHVGMLDAIRSEDTANGITNISEFGSVKDPEGFRGLLAMSAYHQVRDGTEYPAVMLVHGLNDPRVDAWNSAKMAARLQAATASGKPVLLRIDPQDGHGVGRTPGQGRSVDADVYAFLLWQAGQLTSAGTRSP